MLINVPSILIRRMYIIKKTYSVDPDLPFFTQSATNFYVLLCNGKRVMLPYL